MKNNITFGTKYFCLATGILLLFLICRGVFTPYGWIIIESLLPEYVAMECMILVTAFFHKRIREIALLTELLYIVPPILYTFFIYTELDMIRDDIYYCLSMLYHIAIICGWYYIYLKNNDLKQIIIAGIISSAFPFIINSTSLYFWQDLLAGESPYVISTTCLSIIACTIGYILCRCKTLKMFLTIATCSMAVSIWSSLYLAIGIETYLLYGTFTGRTHKALNTKLIDKEHQNVCLKDINTPYIICLIWNTDIKGNAFFWEKEFEKLKDIYIKNKMFTFFLLATSSEEYPNENEPFELHKREQFNIPVLKVENNKQFWNELKAFPRIEIVCIFKKDTLIYKNSISKASQFIKTLQ